MGRDLISKITAGGLSAGIFLLWWPLHLPTDGLAWLVLRGVCWTLTCEALLLAFVPLERMLHSGLRTERVAALVQRAQSAPVRVRGAGAVLLALVGLTVPVSLLTTSATERIPPATATRVVVREVVVERPVVRKRVVVRQVVEPPSSPVTTADASAAAPSGALVRDWVQHRERRKPARRGPGRAHDGDGRNRSRPDAHRPPVDERSIDEAAGERQAPTVPQEAVASPSGSASSAAEPAPGSRPGAPVASRAAPVAA